MTATTVINPNQPLPERVAALEVHVSEQEKSIERVEKIVTRLQWGIISVLLAIVGQLVFKH
jgi:uncharacterized coiled-coil protein SlyX